LIWLRIIRGGGGEVGLASFNDYSLAFSIATFPLPVITGIGHATNQTVSEMVAHTNAITPSELADLLLDRFEIFRDRLNDYTLKLRQVLHKTRDENKHLEYFTERLNTQSLKVLQHNKQQFQELWQAINKQTLNRCKLEDKALTDINTSIRQQGRRRLSKEGERLLVLLQHLKLSISGFLQHNKTQLDFKAKTVLLLDPVNVLRRGYSITYSEGKLVSSIKNVKTGASLKTILQDGELISIINKKSENNE